jgi:glucosamine kinase
MSVLVGVDAGGSHTEAVAADDALEPLGRYRGPRGAVTDRTTTEAAEVIAAVVRRAVADAGLNRPDIVMIGAAGAGRDETKQGLQAAVGAIMGPAVRIRVTTDAAIALEAAFPSQSGIVLIAGSGSIAYARDSSGVIWRVGGLGWQFGDDGSGYALARAALGVVARAADGRGPATALSDRLAKGIGATTLDHIVLWAQHAKPYDVAALAQAVCETADAGDAAATRLVRQTARDLCAHLEALARRLHGAKQLKAALAGGLLTRGSPVRRELVALVREQVKGVTVLDTDVDPAVGALALAARLDG